MTNPYTPPKAVDSPRTADSSSTKPRLGGVAPTKVRHEVLAFSCALSMITYLDRACFGVAAPILVGVLGLASTKDLAWAITAFSISYAAFEIPSGWMGDVFGPRRTLIRIVLW